MAFTSYKIQNDQEFVAALTRVVDKVSDLRVELGLIAKNWRKGNIAQFTLRGAGKYPPLNPMYEARKTKRAGKKLPILVGAARNGGESGRLRDSMINNGSTDSILVIGKSSMIMGTSVPYGIYHQSDAPRSKIPLRKFMFITDANILAWLGILEAATARKIKGK